MTRIDGSMLRLNLKLVSTWPFLANAALLAALFLFALVSKTMGRPVDNSVLHLAIEVTTPVLFAIQTAYLLGPDNEPALELLAASPKPMPGLFLERLLLVGGLQVFTSLLFTCLFVGVLHTDKFGLSILNWLVAAVFLGGLAAFTTQLTRQGVYGTLLAVLLCAASLYGGDGILKVWKWFWPFHIYLQPEKLGLGLYLLNRLVLFGAGLGLFLLAMKLLGDEDRLLLTR